MSIFAPDSILWFGVVLGLVGRFWLGLFSRAVSIILTDAAQRFVERRAHARAQRELRSEAGEGRV